MSLHVRCLLSLILLAVSASASAGTDTVVVDASAPAGGDGSVARPFRSPIEAFAAVHKRMRGEVAVTVRVRPGDYFLPDGLHLGPSDSHLRFIGEKGVRFTRAEKATPGGIVKCPAARPPDYETYSRMAPHAPMFFYDGKWAVEARWPNEGWAEFTKDQVVDSGLRSGGLAGVPPDKPTVPGSFRFANDRPARWDFGAGVYLAGYTTHDWAFDRVRLESFTPSNRLVRLAAAVQYGLCGRTWSDHAGRRFYIYGAKSEMDAPGEYFYDRKSGRVDFVAPQGMREFLAVTREGPIVSVKGASDVTFEGITFEYACGDAVRIEGATNVVVRDSAIRNVGGNGVLLLGGRGCRVERTEIAHCGFCGTRIDAGDRRTLTRADHVIADCEIHDFSRICRTYQPAASVRGCGVTVRGCRIHDAPHSGIIYGGNEHLFADNEVWNILGECGDAGAFYTGRDPTSRGNVLRGNFVHDIGHPEKGSTHTMAFYIDDCDAGDTVVSNRICNVPRGIMIGGGHDNRVIGNSIERCNLAISVDARGVAWTNHWDSPTDKSWQMTRKVKEMPVDEEPWKSRYPLLVNYLNDHPREPRHISIVDNRFIDCKRTWEWGMGAEKYLDVIERRGNVDVRQHVFSMSCKVTSLNGPLATVDGRAKAIAWWRRNHFSALWLESYRHGERVETSRLIEERDAFLRAGFDVRGMITPTMLNDAGVDGKVPMVVCWSDPQARARLSSECLRAADVFDTVILDDFLFSTCGDGCARCHSDKTARGIADWGVYRCALMYEVCEKDILAPVRAAHPRARFIIKYPCWYRNYARNGYDPERQNDLFGACWIGTETRDANPNPLQACWIMDWMDRLSCGRCGGGWYDGLDSTPEKFVEQAYYTILGGARESLVHCYDYLLADDPGRTPFGEKVRQHGACAQAFERHSDRLKELGDFLVGSERLEFVMGPDGVSRHRFRKGNKEYLARLNTTTNAVDGLPPHGFDFACTTSLSGETQKDL